MSTPAMARFNVEFPGIAERRTYVLTSDGVEVALYLVVAGEREHVDTVTPGQRVILSSLAHELRRRAASGQPLDLGEAVEVVGPVADLGEYANKVAAGLVEFSHPCPEWCDDAGSRAHQVVEWGTDDQTTGGERYHSRTFGQVVVTATENHERPGQLEGWTVEVLARQAVTVADLEQLAHHARAAALWLVEVAA